MPEFLSEIEIGNDMLEAYTDSISIAPGGSLKLMVSTDHPHYSVGVARQLHGDPNSQGPGHLEEAVTWAQPGPHVGSVQPLRIGSYGELPAPDEFPSDFTFACWICPTSPFPNNQTIVSSGNVHLRIDAQWRLLAEIGNESVELARQLYPWRWHFIGMTYTANEQMLGVFAGQRGALGPAVTRKKIDKAIVRPSKQIFLAATLRNNEPANCYNGKIGHVTLLASYLDDIGLYQLQADSSDAPLSKWNFSLEIESDRVIDVSRHGRHGRLINDPARGVTGHTWNGRNSKMYADAPEQYDAVHIHDDDLADAGWTCSVTVQVPADARSGIYAAHVRAGNERWTLSFIVRASQLNPPAPILYVVPTLTWQAYGNRGRPDHEARYGPSLYGTHSDGTSVYRMSLRKPISTFDPKYGFLPNNVSDPCSNSVCHLTMADLYAIHWLEQQRVNYDVICDHDLDQLADDPLEKYRLIVCAGHHEYWTTRMLDRLEGFLDRDSRLMFLSGNGLYWVTSIDSQRPWIAEVRRSQGSGTSEAEPGELQHASDGVRGGIWRSVGRASNAITGVGFSGIGFAHRASGFRRAAGSYDPRAAFIFDGVGDSEIIGDFGLNQGGAAGFEIDRADYSLGTPSHALILATSDELAGSFCGAKEDGLGRAPLDKEVRADIVYFQRESGAKVFSVGSVTWTGSLSYNRYDNNVARITNNVLHRFLCEVTEAGHEIQ